MKILRLQILDYEVFQQRENLQFYGIHEETPNEDTKGILYNFLETKLGMRNGCDVEFQRVHRVGKQKQGSELRAIIARSLKYQDVKMFSPIVLLLWGNKVWELVLTCQGKRLKFTRGLS